MSDTPTPLEAERLGAVLTEVGIRWLRAADGAFVARFADGPDDPRPVTILYRVDGEGGDVLAVRGFTLPVYDPDAWPALVGLANTWHCAHRWPKVALVHDGAEGHLVAAVDVFVAAGVTDAQLAVILGTATVTTRECHRWLAEQYQVATRAAEQVISAEDLEDWFRRAA